MAQLRYDVLFNVKGLNVLGRVPSMFNNINKGAYRASRGMQNVSNAARTASHQMSRASTSIQSSAAAFTSAGKQMERVLGQMKADGASKKNLMFARQAMSNNPNLIPMMTDGSEEGIPAGKKNLFGMSQGLATASAGALALVSALGLLAAGLRVMVSTVGWAARNFDQFANQSGDYARSYARINMVNDGTKTTDQMYEEIYTSAQKSRSPMGEMANNFGKMGILAGDAFKNNDEMLRFQELLAKQFKVGGASQAESSNATYQLIQALAADRLQGDEMRSIRENAPLLIDAISQQTGLKGKALTEAARDAKINSQVIVDSVMNMGNAWERQFNEIPVIWEDVKTRLLNTMQFGLQPLFKQFNDWLNMDSTQKAISDLGNLLVEYVPQIVTAFGNLFTSITGSNDAVTGFNNLMEATAGYIEMGIKVINDIADAIRWMADNWDWVRLVLLALGTVLASTIFMMNPLIGILAYFGVVSTTVAGDFAFAAAEIGGSANSMSGEVKYRTDIASGAMINMAGNSANAADAFQGSAAGISKSSADMARNVTENAKSASLAMLALSKMSSGSGRGGGFTAGGGAGGGGGGGGAGSPEGVYIPPFRSTYQEKVGGGGKRAKMTDSGGSKGGGGGKPNVGTVDEVKKVGITDEERKYLREIASQKYINQYTTLAPNLKIEVAEVKETADINKIMAEAERMVENSWANSLVGA